VNPRRSILVALLAAAALFFAGCGEKEEPATTGPVVPETDATSTATGSTTETTEATDSTGSASPASVTRSAPVAVQAFLSSPDAEVVCDEVITPALLKTAYGDRAGCIAARKPDTLADPDSRLEVGPESGSGTRVDAQPAGGLYDGEKLTFTVVQDGDAYRIDALKSDVPVGP
jgi:hypothetical protein